MATLEAAAPPPSSGTGPVFTHGDLKYVVEEGGNDSTPSYQEAVGAPVETHSPLGTHVGWVTIVALNVGKMMGTGIFSTPARILNNSGSTGLALIMWLIGYLMALSGMGVYMEFASYFPNRSGSETVYLEQSYPRPKWFFPATFAFQTILFSFSSSNCIVLAQYLFRMADVEPAPWASKGVAVAAYTVAVLFALFNTKWSLRLVNIISSIKLLTLLFIAITGLVVLGGHTKVADPHMNFRNAFEGTTASGYGITSSLLSIVFSYAGYENSFNVVNEINRPIKTLRYSVPASVTLVAVFYMLANVAYFAAVPNSDLKESDEVAASLFFTAVFGSSGASRGLNFLIVLSAFGNLLSVLIGQSRLIRECGRQGVLPWPRFWASTKPFGTPFGPYTLKWVTTIIVILALPAGDAFNFVVDLGVYPDAVFKFLMAVGLYFLRFKRKRQGFPKAEYKAWHIAICFYILINFYLLAMPWYPPPGGRYAGSVSFWYATYAVVGLGLLAVCGIYYVLWIFIIPKWKGYQVRQETLELDNGANAHHLVKVPVSQLEQWDNEHDATGRRINSRSDYSEEGELDVQHAKAL